jgi:hypothetical protein
VVSSPTTLFFAGCSEEQADLPFDFRVLLTSTAPPAELADALLARIGGLGSASEHGGSK